MKKFVGFLTIITCILFAFQIALATETVINFDDVIVTDGSATGLDGTNYEGFVWSGGNYPGLSYYWVISPESADWNFGNNPAHSSPNYAWSNGGADLYLSAAKKFDFESMWVRAGPQNGPAQYNPLTVNGYLNDVLIYSDSFQLVQGAPYQLISLDFKNVDQVTISTELGYNLLLDDITVKAPWLHPVPEPATMLLFGTGLVGLVGLRRRFKK